MEQLVHCVAALCVTLAVGLLVLGWRDQAAIDLSDQLAALLSIFAGIGFGVAWKLTEFVLDWVFVIDLQKSNSQTMLDLLANDVGAVVAAVLATRLYCHALSTRQRQEFGAAAAWLVRGSNRVLDRHGVLVTIVVAG